MAALCCPLVALGATQIEVAPTASVRSRTVLLSDVATIEETNKQLGKELASVDLTALDTVGDTGRIDRSLIKLRLSLAGYDVSELNIIGAESTFVTRVETKSTDQIVIAMLQQELSLVWNAEERDVMVTLVRPLKRDALQLGEQNYDIRPLIAKTPQLGSNQVRFGAYKHGSLQETFVASVDIRLTKELAVAVQTIPAGKLITNKDVEVRRKMFRDREALHANSDVIGLEAARTIRPGDLVAPAYVRRPRSIVQGKQFVVRRRSRVRLTAVKKGLTVSIPQVESLDDGAVGDTIRVRNLQSGKIVFARVQDSNTVTIKL